MSISQLALVAGIMKLVGKETPTLTVRQTNAIIKAADLIVEELRKPDRDFTPGGGIDQWLASDKTGLSSLFMAFTLVKRAPHAQYAHPHDPGDFGRCLGLLEACPELRAELPKMAEASPVWAALVREWDQLEALYREELPTGRASKLYDRMGELIQNATA